MKTYNQIGPALIAEIKRRKSDIANKWYEYQFSEEILKSYPNAYAEQAARDTVISQYMLPMLDLLIEYASYEDKTFKYLYLALKRTYAPHRDGHMTLKNYYSQVIPNEISVLVEKLPESSRHSARMWLEDLYRDLLKNEEMEPLTMAFIGDCILSEIISMLGGMCDESGISLDPRFYYFSALMGVDLDISDVAQLLSSTPIDIIAVSFLTYEGIPFYRALLKEAKELSDSDVDDRVSMIIELMRSYIRRLRELTDATIFLHNTSGLPLSRFRGRFPLLSPISRQHQKVIDKLNRSIEILAGEFSNLLIIDEVTIVQRHGLRSCHRSILPKNIRKKATFHPTYFGIHLADKYFEMVSACHLLKGIKLLLIDFDNTLWNGVMAEGEVEQDIEFQKLLSRLKDQGILLAAVSKNDPESIRWEEMYLKESDFVSLKVNWNLKAYSVLEIADELNLGVNSFLLIDDNPIERELVEKNVKGVRTLDAQCLGRNCILETLFYMPNTKDTDEARTRTGMYKAQSKRNLALKQNMDYVGMMSSLGLKLAFGRPAKKDLDRVCELIERTNQFNTTTTRYTRQEVIDIVNGEDGGIYIGKLEDKFGKLGTVAVVVVKRNGDVALIDNFIMSCRAMGFGLETLMLSLVINEEKNCQHIHARFVPSERNHPSSGLFKNAGFNEEESGIWVLPEKASLVDAPNWFEIKHL